LFGGLSGARSDFRRVSRLERRLQPGLAAPQSGSFCVRAGGLGDKLDAGGDNVGPRRIGQFLAEAYVPKSRQFDQGLPDGMHQMVLDE
jgi:hypothetical protein